MADRRTFMDSHGFSLTELIVVMAIFMSVLIVTSTAFNTILTNSGQQMKSAETQIEGIVGLELFRSDLQHVGFGLPWGPATFITYSECTASAVNNVDPTSLNESSTTLPPCAVRGVDGDGSHGFNGSDYLVIRSTVSGLNSTAKKWTYMHYTSTGSSAKLRSPSDDLMNNERVIVVRTNFVSGSVSANKILVTSSGAFSTKASVSGGIITLPDYPTNSGFNPPSSTDTYLVYGVDPDTDLRMPFNRTDYFIDRGTATLPKSCANKTGSLYKAVVNQKSGGLTRYPLLDCVADMQVVYSLDTGSGQIDLHDNASLTSLGSPPTAQAIRDQVREIRIYILTQDGQKDNRFTFPNQKVPVGEMLNGTFYGSEFDLATIGTDWSHYRWKVYTIVIQPKSLN